MDYIFSIQCILLYCNIPFNLLDGSSPICPELKRNEKMNCILLCAVDVHYTTFVISFHTATLTTYHRHYIGCQDNTEMLESKITETVMIKAEASCDFKTASHAEGTFCHFIQKYGWERVISWRFKAEVYNGGI